MEGSRVEDDLFRLLGEITSLSLSNYFLQSKNSVVTTLKGFCPYRKRLKRDPRDERRRSKGRTDGSSGDESPKVEKGEVSWDVGSALHQFRRPTTRYPGRHKLVRTAFPPPPPTFLLTFVRSHHSLWVSSPLFRGGGGAEVSIGSPNSPSPTDMQGR